MPSTTALEMTLLPGARALLAVHSRELPQRDDLCGAFCGALALNAAGIETRGGEPVDQDAVALFAGSIVSGARDDGTLPHGEPGRRDYRIALASTEDHDASGTTAAGLLHAIDEISDGRLTGIPYSGPWTTSTLAGIFAVVAALRRPVTLVANLATHHLWGAHPSLAQLIDCLLDGEQAGPPPDWDVGHFVCVIGRMQGPGGSLYAIADTYPSLGDGGVHMQPQERLAAAIERRDMPAGGMIVVAFSEDGAAVRAGARALGLTEGIWDNGTATQATAQ